MVSRREFLTALGAAVGSTLAGCLGPDPSIDEREFNTVDAECVKEQTDEGMLSAGDMDGEVQFQGGVPENHPGFSAFAVYGFDGKTLIIDVRTQKEQSIGIDCGAEVMYEGRVVVSNADGVRLRHKGNVVDTYEFEDN